MSDERKPEPVSWRDPDGFVVKVDGRILRATKLEKSDQTRALVKSAWLGRFIAAGSIPCTAEVATPHSVMEGADDWFWLEHDPLPFPCYPHEITALQLYDAGELTLNIAVEAAQNGWVLKDASAWNVLYARGRAIFVDLLSFERREPAGAWIAYGQFIRHFLLPLMLYQQLQMTPADVFLGNRDGITPERAFQLLSGLSLTNSTALELILLPKWLSRAGSRLIESQTSNKSRKIRAAIGTDPLLSTLHRLKRILGKLQPEKAVPKSAWKSYEEERLHYSDADLAAKAGFVRRHLRGAESVLDLGCNAGEFSLLAAERAPMVVAADGDHSVLSRLYGRVREQSKAITPLLLNIGRPTPAVGWENGEVASFIERACGYFDCILALGLVHHLLISERATMPMLVHLFDHLGPKRLIIEWVDPMDQKFRQLAGLNATLYSKLNSERFEDGMRKKFALAAKLPLPCGTRVMYSWSR